MEKTINYKDNNYKVVFTSTRTRELNNVIFNNLKLTTVNNVFISKYTSTNYGITWHDDETDIIVVAKTLIDKFIESRNKPITQIEKFELWDGIFRDE